MSRWRWEVLEAIAADRVLGIVRAPDAGAAGAALGALLDAGLRAVEVSLTTPGALDVIWAHAAPGRLVGAGTVLDAASAREAVAAGARFLVSPVLAEDVIATGHRHGAAVVAGAGTATEALTALERGADLVKLFPAGAWSPETVRDLLQALPQLPLVPTGGIRPEDAPAWLAAGAVAVGMGGPLTGAPPEQARRRVRELLDATREAA